MKKLVYILIADCLLLITNCYSQPSVKWSEISTPKILQPDSIFNWQYYPFPFPYTFTDISFVDLTYGWATYTGNGVARTTDGGISWDTSSFGSSNYMGGVYFINRSTGWAVGGMGRIRKTINGGVNWIIQDYEVYAGYYRKVQFFDENTGFIVGEKNGPYAYIIKTINSGVNWNDIFVSPTYDSELLNQYWLNSSTGWACGSNILIKTTNSGLNFANFYSSIPPTQNGANWLSSIVFANDSSGWIGAGNLDKKNIYKTTNGGLNWFFQNNPVTQYEYPQINDVEFISPDSGWAASLVGIILFTSNGGNNWVIDNTANAEFWCLSSFQKLKVWSGAYPGQIWSAVIHEPNGVLNQGEQLPNNFSLYQNYPNPFNPTTKLRFSIPPSKGARGMITRFVIYDVLGRAIAVLVNQELKPGTYEVDWDGSNYPSGVYFYRLTAGD